MKSIIPIKIAALIAFGVLFGGTAEANIDKHVRPVRLSTVNIEPMTLIRNHLVLHFPSMITQPVEDWMFSTDYLTEESHSLESWMFDASHLDEVTESSQLEGWMFDRHYLSK